jgi:putative component of toxin-antitoxin plasmid stabilization module
MGIGGVRWRHCRSWRAQSTRLLLDCRRSPVIVVMLNAGNKPTQKRDIRHALKLDSELGDDL